MSRLLLILCFLLSGIAAHAQSTKTQDSASFRELSSQFETRLKQYPTLSPELQNLFYQKAQKLRDEYFHGQAAALIAEALLKKHQRKEADRWYTVAMQHFEHAKNISASGECNTRIGKALMREYDFESGLPYLLKSVTELEQAGNHNQQARSYNALALAYHDFGDYDKGRSYALMAKALLDAHPQGRNNNIYWYVYNNLGINYDDDNAPQEAINAHLKALPYAISANDSSYSYNNLGNTSKKIGKLDAAEYYLGLSLNAALHDPENDIYNYATIYSNLTDLYTIKKDYPKAAFYLDSALHYALASGSPEKLIDVYRYAAGLKVRTGDYATASLYTDRYFKLKDSLLSVEKAKVLYDYQEKYEREKKEKELSNANLKIAESQLESNRKDQWLRLLAGLVLTAGILFWSYQSRAQLRQKQLRLENHLLEEQAITKVQEQRLEISRDLHDSLGAQLTCMVSLLDDMKQSSGKSAAPDTGRLEMLSEFSANAITELKNALWVLNTREIRMEDLCFRMMNFKKNAEAARRDTRFHFDFQVVEERPLDSKEATSILRIYQEIINNSLKHSQAKDISIRMQQNGDRLHLEFADNGIGFDLEQEKDRSFGLSNIQDRVKQINGTVRLETAYGKGTAYFIDLPLLQPPAETI